MVKKSSVFQWVGIIISVAAVGLLIRSLQLERVEAALLAAQFAWLVPAVIFSLLSFIPRAERFRIFLVSFSPFSLRRSYQYIALNYMGNNVLPARAGEVLLSYVVKQQERIPISSSLAVTILGRVIDGLLMLMVLAISLLLLPFPLWVDSVVVFGLVIFGGIFMVLLWLVFGRSQDHQRILGLIHRLTPQWFERLVTIIIGWAKEFQQGLVGLRSGRTVIKGLVFSIAIWCCEALVYYFVGRAVGISLTPVRLLFTLALVNLTSSIPSAPASLGTFEGIVVIALSLGGVSVNQAAAYAVLLHVTQVLPITTIGAISYFRMSLGGFRRKLPEASESLSME